MTHPKLDAMLAESGLAPDGAGELADVFEPLAGLAEDVPTPSAELLALFGGVASGDASFQEPPRVVSLKGRRRGGGTVAGIVVLALSGVGATGLSAAANTLPSPWQHQVSNFSRQYLPFDFPQPPVRRLRHARRGPDAAQAPMQAAPSRRDAQRRVERAEEPTRSLSRDRDAANGVPVHSVHPVPRDQRPAEKTPRSSPTPGLHTSAAAAKPPVEESEHGSPYEDRDRGTASGAGHDTGRTLDKDPRKERDVGDVSPGPGKETNPGQDKKDGAHAHPGDQPRGDPVTGAGHSGSGKDPPRDSDRGNGDGGAQGGDQGGQGADDASPVGEDVVPDLGQSLSTRATRLIVGQTGF